jgi:hypothetical protein
MAKARSRRTLRNRKSRNRRGGVFRFFISDDKKAFKEARDNANDFDKIALYRYIFNSLNSENGIEKIQKLFGDLSTTARDVSPWFGISDRQILVNCIAEMIIKNFITDDKVKDISFYSDINKAKKEIESKAQNLKLNIESMEKLTSESVKPTIGFKNPTEQLKQLKEKIDKEQKAEETLRQELKPTQRVNQNSEIHDKTPLLISDGGKSRRRHRRGRTLHKRRKSRKVRKTRCRRK